MSPYSRQTIHDRRQSMMASHGRAPNTPPPSGDSRPRPDYPTQEAHPSLADDIPAGLDASQPTSSWDPAQSQAQPHAPDSHARGLESYSAVQMNLPPLSEALHSLSASSPSMAVSPPMPTHQAALSSMSNVMASPPQFYATNAYLEMQAPVNIYTAQDQFDSNPSRTQERHSSQTHGVNGMVSQDPNSNSSYNRRMTYPFVPSLETSGANLVMSNVMSTEQAGSSPLSNNGAFPQGGLVGASPVMDYVDSLALQQHQVHPQAASHHHTHTQPTQPQQALHSTTWSQNGSSMQSIDGGANDSKVYSFVPLSGVNSRKRPRRRFEEIERLYVCSWGDCEKAYGTLNHLNAHVNMQKHGPKRLPAVEESLA
ncbi:hypothetical protein BGZ98_008048 [Dissophora globulifera]|nr:hypothetical protein BGZ98_008048 [Dissophora globulifera]